MSREGAAEKLHDGPRSYSVRVRDLATSMPTKLTALAPCATRTVSLALRRTAA